MKSLELFAFVAALLVLAYVIGLGALTMVEYLTKAFGW